MTIGMPHKTIIGRLRYSSNKPEIKGRTRGGELFIITKHTDGSRTLRAHCEIAENEPRVLRDVVIHYDKDWRVQMATVRVMADDRLDGHSWFRFGPDFAECEGWTRSEGRISQRFELDAPTVTLGSHPIQGDAWHLSAVDISKGPHRTEIPAIFMSSVHHRGCDTAMLIRRKSLVLHFLGEEEIEVMGTRKPALHFKYGDMDDTGERRDVHPPYHVWTSADGNYIFYTGGCGGYMQTQYDLVELREHGMVDWPD